MEKKVTVIVDPQACITTVGKLLEERGCRIDAILEEVGIIYGTADSQSFASLKNIPGIVDIEDSSGCVPPPDSDVQ